MRPQVETLESIVGDGPFVGQFISTLIMYHVELF